MVGIKKKDGKFAMDNHSNLWGTNPWFICGTREKSEQNDFTRLFSLRGLNDDSDIFISINTGGSKIRTSIPGDAIFLCRNRCDVADR